MPPRFVTHDIWHIDGKSKLTVQTAEQITHEDELALEQLAAGVGLAIEVGTYTGASAAALLRGGAGHLVCVDTFRGTPGSPTDAGMHEDMLIAIVQARLAPFRGRWTLIQGESRGVASALRPGIAELVFIDAAHDYERVKADIEAWWPIVKDGGIMAGHDFDKGLIGHDKTVADNRHYECWNGVHPGVVAAVTEKFQRVSASTHPLSSVWAVRKQQQQEKLCA